MSTSGADYEQLLRKAIDEAKEAAPRVIEDLFRCASKAAQAVTAVTGGAAAFELVLQNQAADTPETYQLQLRKVGSEAPPSDLGIYRVSESGYPVFRWYSRSSWMSKPDDPDNSFSNLSELEGHFRWMISNRDSRLVLLVTFLQQQALSSKHR